MALRMVTTNGKFAAKIRFYHEYNVVKREVTEQRFR